MMIDFLYKKYPILFLLFLTLSCCQPSNISLESPSIITGSSKVTGKIINSTTDNDEYIYINVSHPISNENVQYKALVDRSGCFSTDVILETDFSLVGIYTDINPSKNLFIELEKDKETKIEISYDTINNVNVSVNNSRIGQCDMIYGVEIMTNMIDYRSNNPRERLFEKDPDYFLSYTDKILTERLSILKNDSCLSENMKEVLAKDFSMFLYIAHVFDYENEMNRNYLNTKGEDANKEYKTQTIGRNYYDFLKKFNLNDPQNLYCFSFPTFMQKILQNEILNIPPISENPIDKWLKDVKEILSDLVGFDHGLFYDVLIANAFALQFNNELNPLSEKQIENIQTYFKGNEIEKILLKKNEEIVKLNSEMAKLVINNTPPVPQGELMNTIVSKYKGKVILVDFWETWCAPCLNAMHDMRQFKKDMINKDIVFVYISSVSSPRKLWEQKIGGIGGEHYYLTEQEWEYLYNNLNISGIPTYQMYDTDGSLKKQFTGYPGNEKMRAWIEELLVNE